MNRVVWFIICTVVGAELIAWGLLVPVHMRAMDSRVLQLAGANSPSVVDEGLLLVRSEKIGPAKMLLQVADQTGASGRERLAMAIQGYETAHPKLQPWGGGAPYLEQVFAKRSLPGVPQSRPIVDMLIWPDARQMLVQALGYSRREGVLDILKTRELTNTVVFPPAKSASGDPMDTVIATTALLFQQDAFSGQVARSLQAMVATANTGGTVRPLEAFYVDVLALGKRLDWMQLASLVEKARDTNALQQTARLIREQERHLPVVYTAIHFSESPGVVAKYLDRFPGSGVRDLSFALRSGSGALRDLLERQQPVHYPTVRDRLVRYAPVRAVFEPLAEVAANQPGFGFLMKYGLCFLGALLLARAVTYLSPSLVEEIVERRPLLTGPQVAIALCLLFMVLFFTESTMSWAAPAGQPQMRLKFPVASPAIRAAIPQPVRVMIDKLSVVSLLLFFVLQAGIYVACRMKLAEIRRQSLSSKLKLRLLENEEHLFDAGLYFGFVGTVLSLVLVSLGVVKFSLMAAYSSTSFGIIFVSIVKIFHVRPYRRRLIMDSEVAERQVQPA